MNRLVARRRKDQRGVSLVLVLVALTIFGLIVPVLGQFGSVNGISAYIVKGQRYDRYAADNGMNAAIAWAASRRTAGREHVPCPDIVTDVPGQSVTSNRHVVVKCTGFATSGVPFDNGSIPAYAVLGLNPGRHSVDIETDVNGRLKTRGAWWANGNAGDTSADIHGVQIDATDDLFGATGSCHPSAGAHIWAAPLQCDSNRVVEDPGYTSTLATLAGSHADRVLDCASIQANGVLALAPGIHWDAAFLTQASTGRCSGHPNVVIWLQPGPHYFDFDFYDPRADTEWTMGGSSRGTATVIGGVPVGWDPGGAPDQNAAARAAVNQDNAATTAGACDLGAPGVELVLGSTSHLTVNSSTQFELCPFRTDSSGQHLAISGPKISEAAPSSDVAVSTPRTAVPDASTGFSWPPALPVPPEPNPLAAPECSRDSCEPRLFQEGRLEGRRGRTGTVQMLVPNRIPENAKINTLVLEVRHREPTSDNGDGDRRDQIDGISAVISGLGVDATCRRVGPNENWTTDGLQCTLARPIPAPNPADVPDLQVALTFTTNGGDNNSAIEQLDYVAVGANVTRAGIRAERCPDSRCRVVDIDNGSAGSAFVWGTVYLPTAAVHADLGGRTAFKFGRGVVADSVILENLSSDPSFVPIELPGGGIYTTRIVAFEATVGTATEPTLKSRVSFADPTTAPGVPPVFPVPAILSWNPHK